MESEEPNAQNLTTRMRGIVTVVAALNLLGMVGEVVVASLIGSVSLFADAADFLEDFLINLLVVLALGWSVASRRRAARGLAALILIPALAAFGTAVWKLFSGQPPQAEALSMTAAAAMVINLACAVLLISMRSGGGALVRGAWLAARNDVLGNVLIVVAGLVTVRWPGIWPDVLIGVVMGVLNLSAAREVLEQARAEVPELELDEG